MIAHVALGSNLDRPIDRIREAIGLLDRARVRVLRRGRLVTSRPVGPQDQPDFVNTVVEVDTDLAPRALLTVCQSVEQDMGRTKHRRWGERVIDLDLILYGDRLVNEPDLIVPHPEATRRSFVLVPLADLIPEGRFPHTEGRIADLASGCGIPELWTLDASVPTREELSLT